MPVDDTRVQQTIQTIQEELTTDDGLVRRYDGDDGLPGEEGSFLLCSFWLVDALALAGQLEEARDLFLDILDYTSPLGLLAEEVDPREGVMVGNFPQGVQSRGAHQLDIVPGSALGAGESGLHPDGARPLMVH